VKHISLLLSVCLLEIPVAVYAANHQISSDAQSYVFTVPGLDDRCSKVQFPAGAGNFSLHQRVHNGFGAHPASYPVGTRGSSPGSKAAGA
jgi:hypothetical protein